MTGTVPEQFMTEEQYLKNPFGGSFEEYKARAIQEIRELNQMPNDDKDSHKKQRLI